MRIALILLLALITDCFAQHDKDKLVAWTFDDLPATRLSTGTCDDEALRSFTVQLLEAMEEAGIDEATGFVNASKRCDSQSEAFFAEILGLWLEAGHELGNHTWSHQDLNTLTANEFETEITRGEEILRRTVEHHGGRLRWFRYPYLHTGDTARKKRAVEEILGRLEYKNAPVTLDNSEWVYAAAYSDAIKAGDEELMVKLADSYIDYMEETLIHFEKLSLDLLGYQLRHVLLLHANELNAATLPRLAAMFKQRGYRFISLAEALKDPAYGQADEYVSTNGVSWLHRWAVTQGREIDWEPDPPKWVMELAGVY